MTDRIDALLNQLKAARIDHDLSRLEAAVWNRISPDRRADFFSRRPVEVQLAVSCGALILGLLVAHVAGYSPMAQPLHSELIVLSEDSVMAPSVILEGGI